MTQVILVTGANRGIGFEICRQLAALDMQVILTSRNPQRGQQAVADLANEGYTVAYHQLDVADATSIATLKKLVQEEYGRLDVLINNAAIYPDEGVSVLDVPPETVQQTFMTNTLGPLMLCHAFIPMMQEQKYGRIVNISSRMGSFAELGSGTAAYRISKAALNALTRILASEVRSYSNIKVNSMCPGWVKTDMGGRGAPRSVEQGADTAVWLATLLENGATNGFFRDRQPIAW